MRGHLDVLVATDEYGSTLLHEVPWRQLVSFMFFHVFPPIVDHYYWIFLSFLNMQDISWHILTYLDISWHILTYLDILPLNSKQEKWGWSKTLRYGSTDVASMESHGTILSMKPSISLNHHVYHVSTWHCIYPPVLEPGWKFHEHNT